MGHINTLPQIPVSFNNLFLSHHYITATEMSFVNERNPNVDQYFPYQKPAIGAAYPAVWSSHPEHPKGPDHEHLLPPVRFPPECDPAQALPTHHDQGSHLQEQGLGVSHVPVQR